MQLTQARMSCDGFVDKCSVRELERPDAPCRVLLERREHQMGTVNVVADGE
jgi:hypothetical protein